MGISLKSFIRNVGPTWTGKPDLSNGLSPITKEGRINRAGLGVDYGKNDWSLLPRNSQDWGRRFGMGAVEAGFYEKANRTLDGNVEDPPPPEAPGSPPHPGEANDEVRKREQEDAARRKRRKYYGNSNSAGFGTPDVSGSALLLGE